MDVGLDLVIGIYLLPDALKWNLGYCHHTVPVLLALPREPRITVMVHRSTLV